MTITVIGNDADGNLVNTMGLHADLAADCLMSEFSGRKIIYQGEKVPLTRDLARTRYIETTGIPFPKQLEVIFPGENYADRRDKCESQYVERKKVEVYKAADMFPDVKPAIAQLRKDGVVCTIATSTEHDIIKECIERGGMSVGYGADFYTLTGCEYGSKQKHIEEIIMGQLGADNIFFTGDSPSDVGLSQKMDGVITIGRYGTKEDGMHSQESLKKAGAAFTTTDFREIPKFIEKSI